MSSCRRVWCSCRMGVHGYTSIFGSSQMPVTKSCATKLTFCVYTAHMREGFGSSCAPRDTGHCRVTRRWKNWSSVV